MKTHILLLCFAISIPTLTDLMVDRDFAKPSQEVAYSTSEASELHRLQDAAIRRKMTTGEKRAALQILFGGQP